MWIISHMLYCYSKQMFCCSKCWCLHEMCTFCIRVPHVRSLIIEMVLAYADRMCQAVIATIVISRFGTWMILKAISTRADYNLQTSHVLQLRYRLSRFYSRSATAEYFTWDLRIVCVEAIKVQQCSLKHVCLQYKPATQRPWRHKALHKVKFSLLEMERMCWACFNRSMISFSEPHLDGTHNNNHACEFRTHTIRIVQSCWPIMNTMKSWFLFHIQLGIVKLVHSIASVIRWTLCRRFERSLGRMTLHVQISLDHILNLMRISTGN